MEPLWPGADRGEPLYTMPANTNQVRPTRPPGIVNLVSPHEPLRPPTDVFGPPDRVTIFGPRDRWDEMARRPERSTLFGNQMVSPDQGELPIRYGTNTTARTRARQNLGSLVEGAYQTQQQLGQPPTNAATNLSNQDPSLASPGQSSLDDMADMQRQRLQLRDAPRRQRALQEGTAILPPEEQTAGSSVDQGRMTAAAERAAPAAPEVTVYDGGEYSCSLCLENMQEGERVCRLRCRHVFHAACWDQMRNANNASCPNCRGSPDIIAI